ncbi:MAG: chemotaxis protein [Cellvibrionaceae bacterium]|nr:chemotaxis protein [Cellvibrionaceae bacterium]
MKLNSHSLQARLILLVMGGLLSLLTVSILSMSALNDSLADYRELLHEHVRIENSINQMNFTFKVQVQEWKNTLLRGYDNSNREKYWGRFKQRQDEIQNLGNQLIPSIKAPDKQAQVREFIDSHATMGTKYNQGFNDFVAADYDPKAGDKAVKGMDRAPSKLLTNAAADFAKERADFAKLVEEHSESVSFWSLVAVICVTLIVIGFLWLVLKNAFLNPLSIVMGKITQLSEGDFTATIDTSGNDELGQLSRNLSHMQSEIVEVLTRVKNTSNELQTASQSINQTASNITQHTGATEQYTDQVSNAISEMSDTVQDVAANAAGAADAAQQADQNAQQGLKVMDETITSINALSDEVDRVANAMNQLEKDTASVGAVLDVIKGIAEQTNLLALNAAIEAARAGEQGRGFAVVADEVRALAQRTQESTEEIQQIIETVQNGAAQAVKAMEGSQEQTRNTVELATNAGGSIQEITGSVTSIRDMNTQIATAAEQQSCAADEIRKNVESMAGLARDAHSSAQESTAVANRLDESSNDLSQLIARFRT